MNQAPVRTSRAPRRSSIPVLFDDITVLDLAAIDFEPQRVFTLFDDGLRRRWERIALGSGIEATRP